MNQQIQSHRSNIDELDEQIIKMISDRQTEAKEIGKIKEEADLPVYDQKRELDARTKRKHLAKKLGVDPLRMDMIFEQIVLLARDTQRGKIKALEFEEGKKVIVGVMGGIGSFSEAAALEYLEKHGVKDFELTYPISSENVLKDLEEGRIDLGIFPIENSTAGLVVESIYASSQHQFEIQEIFEFDVIHCLMVLPGIKREEINKIMSHPQALKQCKEYLKKNFPNAELIDATDTAEGARVLEQSPEDRDIGVIAPKRAAELYHLEILEEGIQDLKVNFTRFIAAKKT